MSVIKSNHADVYIPEDTNFLDFIKRRAKHIENKVVFIDDGGGRSITYAELFTLTNQIGGALYHRGLRKGDFVLSALPNTIDCIVFNYAVISVGGIVAVADPLEQEIELERRILEIRPKFVFSDIPAATHVKNINLKKGLLVQEIFVTSPFPGCSSMDSLQNEEHPMPNVAINAKEDVAYMCYTSGTSGHPKGVLITHHNLVSSAAIYKNSPQTNQCEDDRVITPMPMFHAGGVYISYHNIAIGSTLLLCRRFQMEEFLRTIEKYQLTVVWLPAPAIVMIYKKLHSYQVDLSSVHTICTGAAPVKEIVSKMTSKCFPKMTRVMQVWGMTECAINMICQPQEGWRHGSMGQLAPNSLVKICNPNTGTILPRGQPGHLHLKSPTVMKGYFGNQKATKEVIKDGWLATGDIVYCDKDGFFYFVDRLKEIIKWNAHTIAPAELESILVSHPDILDAAVYGIPDEVSGELVRAAVVRRPNCNLSDEDVIQFVRNRVSPVKRIRGGIEFVENIEKTASGKILRRFLREKYKRELQSKL